jgi:CRP-like cAMP-binding protein
MTRSEVPGRVPPANRLLAALSPPELDRLQPYLEPAALGIRDVLYEPFDLISYVWFPTSGMVSLLSPPDDGRDMGIEVGVVGREGMAGLAVFLGVRRASLRCIVQVPGSALRLRADDFRSLVLRDGAFHGLLLRYTHAFIAQVAQAVACNSLHPVEQRLCRWLLTTRSRAGSDEFPMTHEFLAAMLGVRRASVTEAARDLARAGLIRYGRGQVTVLDGDGLEESACGCHRVVQEEFDRLHA